MIRPLLAVLLCLGLAAPAEAASRRHGHRARGHLRIHTPIEAPPPLRRQAPVALPGLTSRPVRLGQPPVAPNAPNNLPPVNAPQPVP